LSGIGKEKAEKLEERKKAKRLKEAFPARNIHSHRYDFCVPRKMKLKKRKKGHLEKKNDSQINQTIQGWTLIVEDKG
jgi:hypothetical protein